MGTISTVNPATGDILATYDLHDRHEVEAALEAGKKTFSAFKASSAQERSGLLKNAAGLLRARADDFARIITGEMGKPVSQARAEVLKCALVCEYYGDHGPSFLKPDVVETEAFRSYVRYDPIGIVLAVMPWNFPFWQVFRFAAPALAAGNCALLKHASNVPGCALAIEDVLSEAGFPEGAFQALLIDSSHVSGVIDDPRVAAVTLTGSEAAGSMVAERAGKAIKKTVLELGGSDPFIVLADADLENCVRAAVTARTQNTGQSCIAAKRFIIEAPLYSTFTERFVDAMSSLVSGDPGLEETEIGPLAREDLVVELERQIERSLDMGAIVKAGGSRLDGPGFFFAPTVLCDVVPGMPAWDEETFGPVAAVAKAADAEEAIRLANNSRYGLGASVWTAGLEKAEDLASRIEAGSVFVNSFVRSDPRLPFGGIKLSGYGRELSSLGLREFVNVKTVWVE
jgi:succinate-semialdehyde dehydrogenase/glutarate-semialdehyde dehydrogenase